MWFEINAIKRLHSNMDPTKNLSYPDLAKVISLTLCSIQRKSQEGYKMEWALYLLIMYNDRENTPAKNIGGIERLATYQIKEECENIAIKLAKEASHKSKSFQSTSTKNIEHQYTCAPVPEAYIYE